MREADLTGARFEGATLRRVDLSGAWLHQAQMTRCDLRGSDISAVDPMNVDLNRAIIDVDQAVVIAASLGIDVRPGVKPVNVSRAESRFPPARSQDVP
jgi:uncharacterized protein YjbI with pentapeptide repeats